MPSQSNGGPRSTRSTARVVIACICCAIALAVVLLG
jgi:hypothetical protein